ncbi:MAG: hypothetical protein QG623_12 [Patescibacteria group bacterium]|nr:hypothetical protein [Patescibacteria group bacterium]
MQTATSKISILTKGNVLTTFTEAEQQVAWLEQTVTERASLACGEGGQCRVESEVEIDDRHNNIINIATTCQKAGAVCQQTCDAFNEVLSGNQCGSLGFTQPVKLIE